MQLSGIDNLLQYTAMITAPYKVICGIAGSIGNVLKCSGGFLTHVPKLHVDVLLKIGRRKCDS